MKEGSGWNFGLDKEMSGGARTILFVEDEAFVRDVISDALRSAGDKVLTSNNADEALAAYRKYAGAVDLLFTDVILPGEKGACRPEKLRRENPELKILFITGYSEQLMCKSEGTECLAKPFSWLVRLRKIKQLLECQQPWDGEQRLVRRACDNS